MLENAVLAVALNLKSKKLANWSKVGHVLGVKKFLEFRYSFGRLGEE